MVFDDAVEFGHEGRAVTAALLPFGERVGVDAEADVVEAEFCHERDVVGGGEGSEVFDRVAAGVLGEPDAGVDAVAQVLRPGEGGVGLG